MTQRSCNISIALETDAPLLAALLQEDEGEVVELPRGFAPATNISTHAVLSLPLSSPAGGSYRLPVGSPAWLQASQHTGDLQQQAPAAELAIPGGGTVLRGQQGPWAERRGRQKVV